MQLELGLDWGREPWDGQSPRSLARLVISAKMLKRFGTCVVDKSVVRCPSREAQRFGTDPAQYMCFIHGAPSDGSPQTLYK